MKSFSLIGLLRGLAVFLAVLFSASAALSFISLRLDDPSKYLSLLSGIVLAASVFFGACAASKGSSLLTGLALAFSILALHRIAGAVWFNSGEIFWIKAIIILLSATAGSMFHKKRNTESRSSRRRKNIRKRYSAY